MQSSTVQAPGFCWPLRYLLEGVAPSSLLPAQVPGLLGVEETQNKEKLSTSQTDRAVCALWVWTALGAGLPQVWWNSPGVALPYLAVYRLPGGQSSQSLSRLCRHGGKEECSPRAMNRTQESWFPNTLLQPLALLGCSFLFFPLDSLAPPAVGVQGEPQLWVRVHESLSRCAPQAWPGRGGCKPSEKGCA